MNSYRFKPRASPTWHTNITSKTIAGLTHDLYADMLILMSVYAVILASYLDNIWKILEGKKDVDHEGTAIHICRIHASRFLFEAITRFYETDVQREFWIGKWLNSFLFSRHLNSICRRIFDVVLVAGSRYKTDVVKAAIASIAEPTKKGFKGRL